MELAPLEARPLAWLTQDLPGEVEVSPANLRSARGFLLRQWQIRAHSLGRPRPNDLAGACKFAALFAQRVFGGQLRSNSEHDFVLCQDSVLDLTHTEGIASSTPYAHDRLHHAHKEHVASLVSNLPRVEAWADEFIRSHPRPQS